MIGNDKTRSAPGKETPMAEEKHTPIAHHILPTAATLLALCFLLLSMINVMDLGQKTLIDEMAGAATIFFLASSFFSYTAMRTRKRANFYEKLADYIFISGLAFLSIVSLVIIWGGVK
jgi:predicted membrane channel-forming protein YqfA (hemolysin III family)